MGAKGSREHVHRLNNRSQSSSALYCIDSTCGTDCGPNNSFLASGVVDNNFRSGNGAYFQNPNSLSMSIPADIWQFPSPQKFALGQTTGNQQILNNAAINQHLQSQANGTYQYSNPNQGSSGSSKSHKKGE